MANSMELKATIELNRIQVLELITKALANEGISISHQDIEFVIEEDDRPHSMDSHSIYTLASVKIKNVKINHRTER